MDEEYKKKVRKELSDYFGSDNEEKPSNPNDPHGYGDYFEQMKKKRKQALEGGR